MTKTYGPWIDAKMAVPSHDVVEIEVEFEDGRKELRRAHHRVFPATGNPSGVVRWRTAKECKPDKHGWFKRGEGDPGAFEHVLVWDDHGFPRLLDGADIAGELPTNAGFTHWAPVYPPEGVE